MDLQLTWDMAEKVPGFPQIYNYFYADSDDNEYHASSDGYFTWANGSIWYQRGGREACIKGANLTNREFNLNSVSVKYCSCNAGGKSFWSSSRKLDGSAASGYGAQFMVYVRVKNPEDTDFVSSTITPSSTVTIDDISESNMNSPGTSTRDSAKFGNPDQDPFPTGNAALTLRNYPITDCPVIKPGGIVYVHFRVLGISSDHRTNTTIRFVLDPNEMVIDIEPEQRNYIWVYTRDRGWVLKRPAYVYMNRAWRSIEGD